MEFYHERPILALPQRARSLVSDWLTAADLIKNFIFQRSLESGADVEVAYEKYWKEFESAFWETEISVGRMR